MAKKEKEMPKEQIITLFDKEYKESELSDEQKVMINHVADLERKIQVAGLREPKRPRLLF